tara:strand:- start:1787 stop:2170 length:384 start_codon:yes stop_codon:yes gene_type:complete
MLRNKRGQGLSVNTVIILILAIFVLVLVVLALTGGFGNFVEWIGTIFGGSGLSVQKAALKCDGYCSSYQTTGQDLFAEKYCTEELEVDIDGDKKTDETLFCDEIAQSSCDTITGHTFDNGLVGCGAF